jgi:hypothetical protein
VAIGRLPDAGPTASLITSRPTTVSGVARSDQRHGTGTSIRLTPANGQERLDLDHRSADPEVRLRAHILILPDAGHPWATIGAAQICSASTIGRRGVRIEEEVVDAVFGRPRGRRQSEVHIRASLGVWSVLTLSLTGFRFARNRGSHNPN